MSTQFNNDIYDSWIESIVQIEANIPLQLFIPKPSINVIMVRNSSLTDRILISDNAMISPFRYDTSAEIDGWGVFIRPLGINSCYLLSPVNQTLIIRFISTNKPFEFINLAARTPSSEVLVNRIHDEHIQKPISIPTLSIVSMPAANTEYSITLPIGTKMYIIKERNNNTPFRLAYQTGRVATPTEPFQFIPAGVTKTITGIHRVTSLQIFTASATAGITIEIESWR